MEFPKGGRLRRAEMIEEVRKLCGGLARNEFPEVRKTLLGESGGPFQGGRFISLDDGRNDPDQSAVGAVFCGRVPNQIDFGGVFAGYDASLGLVPVQDELFVHPLLDDVTVHIYRFGIAGEIDGDQPAFQG